MQSLGEYISLRLLPMARLTYLSTGPKLSFGTQNANVSAVNSSPLEVIDQSNGPSSTTASTTFQYRATGAAHILLNDRSTHDAAGSFGVEWQVFQRTSLPGILMYLQQKRPEGQGAIMRLQQFCLTPEDIQQLQVKGVHLRHFHQRQEQVVMVPSGCAYQVCI